MLLQKAALAAPWHCVLFLLTRVSWLLLTFLTALGAAPPGLASREKVLQPIADPSVHGLAGDGTEYAYCCQLSRTLLKARGINLSCVLQVRRLETMVEALQDSVQAERQRRQV